MAINENNVVGDLFWANMAAEQVYNSFDKRAKAVVELQKLIQWAFGIFTTGGVVLTFFAKPDQYHWVAILLFGIGFAILVISYWLTTHASFPVAMELNPNEPASIRTSFTAAIIKNTFIFRLASFTTFVAFSSIAAGVLVQFYQGSMSRQAALVEASLPNQKLKFSSKLEVKGNEMFIPVTVHYKPKKTSIDITVLTCPSQTDQTGSRLFYKVFETDSLGVLYASCPVAASTCYKIIVTASEKMTDGSIFQNTLIKEIAK